MNDIKIEKLCTPILFYGGLIYNLNKADAGELLCGVSMAIATQAFITLTNERDTTSAFYVVECVFLALVAFVLS